MVEKITGRIEEDEVLAIVEYKVQYSITENTQYHREENREESLLAGLE